jgi:hypothetical protein
VWDQDDHGGRVTDPLRRRGARRRVVLIVAIVVALVAPAHAQREIAITGDRLGGFVLPIEPVTGDIVLSALKATAWDVDDTRRLLLQGDVTIGIGRGELIAESATVWLNRLPSSEGLINQVAIYFEELRPSARAAISVAEGREILITASARGEVRLSASDLERQRPRASRIVVRGERRLARYLRRITAEPPPLRDRPALDRPTRPTDRTPVPGGALVTGDPDPPGRVVIPEAPDTLPLVEQTGFVHFSAGATELVPGTEENVIMASGKLVVEYMTNDTGEDWSKITLSAARGVIFTEPGRIAELADDRLTVESLLGIYLEGDVSVSANDGDYTVRSPMVYYDFRSRQAVMLDALLRTYAREGRVPIVARAEELRQVATNQWQARNAVASTSDFRVPHMSLGADRMTVTRRPVTADPSRRESYIVSEGNRLRAGTATVLSWPRFSGTVGDMPLRGLSIGTNDNDGVRIRSRWDLYALSGRDAPEGVTTTLKLDGYTKRGPAVGLDHRYDVDGASGALDLYGLHDDGTDRTSSGADVDQDGATRGRALWEHQTRLNDSWLLQVQAAYISDETFINAWYEDDFENRREFETSAYLKRQKGSGAMTLLAKYELNDFISNNWLLASRQYAVERMPEFTLRRYGDAWFGGGATYSGETRLGRIRFSPDSSTPRQLGLPGRAFGVGDDDRLDSVFRAAGMSTRWVNRFDTRHELTFPREWGALRIMPFLTGRFTAWSDDFEEFSDDPSDSRFFGSAGVRLSTELQRVDNSVTSRVFDLHRMRHIIEPSVTLWYGYTDVDQSDLPEYDTEVESLGSGATIRVGLRNTWQTQRGGPGRWRSVDFLTIDGDVVFNSGDADRESPAPQFFDYRPEYSQFGDHVRTSLIWIPSDSLSVAGEQIIDIDESAIARASIGAELLHNPILSTFFEFRYLDASDTQLFQIGMNYELTPKYRISMSPQWDFDADKFRSYSVRVTRSFPDVNLSVQVRHDDIRDETQVGASIDLVEF